MEATQNVTKARICKVPAGIRVLRSPNDTIGELTTKNKCFVLIYGDCQLPINENTLKNNFRTQNGNLLETERMVYDRVYTVLSLGPIECLMA